MLVLTRKVGQEFFVGDIPIRVIEIRGDKVRLGVTAPFEVPVDRAEVREVKNRDKSKAEGLSE